MIDCDGSAQSSAVIAGLDWLAQNYQLPAVASMSLGSDSPNQALDDAVTAIIDLGITAVIAAGNYNQGQQHSIESLYYAGCCHTSAENCVHVVHCGMPFGDTCALCWYCALCSARAVLHTQ